MQKLYNLLIRLTAFFLPVTGIFSSKMKSFIHGRKYVWDYLNKEINPQEQYIWFHVSSLGEYEQGLPIMQEMRKNFPEYKILLSFFSPSGYEIRKNNPVADITIYLPLDTPKNAKKFIDLVQPKIAFFVKYDFWPNYLKQLKNKNIRTFLVSGIFREKQLFFKKSGKFYRKSLQAFEHFFVQDDNSQKLLQSIGYSNVTIAGDTRFDRVYEITLQQTNLPDIETFIDNKLCIIFGSTWAKDEELISSFINQNKQDIRYIIVPHDIKEKNIARLESSLKKKSVRYTKSTTTEIKNSEVFIIDTIGLLTRIYRYADIAYVGGGFGAGIHNILEPATYGLPVIIGPEYEKFKEARDLVSQKSCMVVTNQATFDQAMNQLINNEELRRKSGQNNTGYVEKQRGATDKIISYLRKD